ncbi:AraC family transcriptional regulator [Apibacter adventoris]|uniref:AraC family transcriptional regulator n=1 Tax=Apibacter adventoris TaxID=1679466 RepID=A0A2S8ADU1_9FLAO|nr:AraC family transcriptional regulator [Apibacter adventoris]PQL93101.1 AraC family transcriptional regulator [Apibacter adventoris]
MELKNTFKSRIRENKIGSDIYLALIDNYTVLTDTISKPVDKRFVQFYFCTKGRATFHFENENQYLLKDGYSLLLYNPNIDIPINISLSKKSKLVIFVITIQNLISYFKGYSEKIPFIKNKIYENSYIEKPLSIQEKLIISQLEDYILDCEFENLYLTLKLHEILIHYFSSSNKKEQENKKMDDKLVLQLNEIKKLLMDNIASPPTLKSISYTVGLSEYKIKEGFKKLYGKTISSFILDTKLEIGKDKLDMKVKQVKEIAYDLGYENPSHFIEAFKKKYGITPKQWMMK